MEECDWVRAAKDATYSNSDEYRVNDFYRFNDENPGGGFGVIYTADDRFDIEVDGKIYDIPEVVQAIIDLLPDDVTVSGRGVFEGDDGGRWAVVVDGREVKVCEVFNVAVGDQVLVKLEDGSEVQGIFLGAWD